MRAASRVEPQPVAQPARAPVRGRGVLVAGKARGQLAVILDRRGVVALEQIHVAAGKERVGQPRAVRKSASPSRETICFCSAASSRSRASSINRSRRRAPFSSGVSGNARGLGHGQPLQLQLAGGFGHGKAVAGLSVEARLARQSPKLLGCLGVAAGVVVGVRQAAQLGDGQTSPRPPSASAWRAPSAPPGSGDGPAGAA